jgi:hypothetical protein
MAWMSLSYPMRQLFLHLNACHLSCDLSQIQYSSQSRHRDISDLLAMIPHPRGSCLQESNVLRHLVSTSTNNEQGQPAHLWFFSLHTLYNCCFFLDSKKKHLHHSTLHTCTYMTNTLFCFSENMIRESNPQSHHRPVV